MSALLIGFLLVVTSAALFGVALFGRRPIPQPAMVGDALHRDGAEPTETAPSRRRGRAALAGGVPGGTTVVPEPVRLSGSDVRVPLVQRVRAIVLLCLSVIGAAVLVGAVLSILVVGVVLLIA